MQNHDSEKARDAALSFSMTEKEEQACGLVFLNDGESMDETEYLRSSSANAQHLLASIRELEGGGSGIVRQNASILLDA